MNHAFATWCFPCLSSWSRASPVAAKNICPDMSGVFFPIEDLQQKRLHLFFKLLEAALEKSEVHSNKITKHIFSSMFLGWFRYPTAPVLMGSREYQTSSLEVMHRAQRTGGIPPAGKRLFGVWGNMFAPKIHVFSHCSEGFRKARLANSCLEKKGVSGTVCFIFDHSVADHSEVIS